MKDWYLLSLLFCLFSFLPLRADVLQIGDKTKVGYSKELYECEVIEIYGKMIGYKTLQEKQQRIFYLMDETRERLVNSRDAKFIRSEEEVNADVSKQAFIEAQHPNGEWYVGQVVDKYGKFIKAQLGDKNWLPVWVPDTKYKKDLLLKTEIDFFDYKHSPIGHITKDGFINNRQDEVIGRVYSTGDVLDFSGVFVGKVQLDGSVVKAENLWLKSNIGFANGVDYQNEESKSLYVMRYKSANIYDAGRPDMVHVYFKPEQLKGNMRIAAAVFFLMKEKF